MKNKKPSNMSQLKEESQTIMQLSTKLNTFLKFTKNTSLNMSQLTEFKKELNIIQLKDKLFTLPLNNQFNNMSNPSNNSFNKAMLHKPMSNLLPWLLPELSHKLMLHNMPNHMPQPHMPLPHMPQPHMPQLNMPHMPQPHMPHLMPQPLMLLMPNNQPQFRTPPSQHNHHNNQKRIDKYNYTK